MPTSHRAAERGAAQRGAAQRGAAQRGAAQEPVALLHGTGQRIVHGNPAFVAEFGGGLVGLPAREVLVGLPARAFDVIDRVRDTGRPLACWLELRGERRRLTVAPRTDPETGEVYGVAIRLAHATPLPGA